jgi:tRNA(Ile2) C34 agmatinyltransferase TiaS
LLIWKGGADAKTAVHAQEQRQLLNIVQAHGQIAISEVVIEMDSTVDNVQSILYQLVGMGLYTGYINWDEGMLYSAQATNLRELTHCQHCNGQLKLAGHGIIRCPYCGTEYFLN